jgi:hypothetical protein
MFVAFKWFMWLKEDDSDTRSELVKWMRIQLFINSALSIIFAILILLGVGVTVKCDDLTEKQCTDLTNTFKEEYVKAAIVPTIIGTCLGIAIMWYFYNVTKRYEAMSA